MKNPFSLNNSEAQKATGCLNRYQAAEYLSISTRLLDNLLSQKEIPKIKIGRKTLIRVVDLDSFLLSKMEQNNEE